MLFKFLSYFVHYQYGSGSIENKTRIEYTHTHVLANATHGYLILNLINNKKFSFPVTLITNTQKLHVEYG